MLYILNLKSPVFFLRIATYSLLLSGKNDVTFEKLRFFIFRKGLLPSSEVFDEKSKSHNRAFVPIGLLAI